MSYAKKNSGDRLVFPAQVYNYLLDAADDYNSTKNDSPSETLLGWPTTFGKCRNDTGADLDRFDVVGIDPPLILPSTNLPVWKRQVNFSAVDPVLARHTGAWAVLAQPIRDQAIGAAIIAGCAPVAVTVPSGGTGSSGSGSSGSGGQLTWAALQSEGAVFAEAQERVGFENILKVDFTGSARVLWCEDQDNSYGWRWAYVRIGAGSGSGAGVSSIIADITVSSLTVTNGTQPGNIQLGSVAATGDISWTTGLSIRVKQIKGFVLDIGKRYKAEFAGNASDGTPVYSTSDQSGTNGSQTLCDGGGAPKTMTIENGIIKAIA